MGATEKDPVPLPSSTCARKILRWLDCRHVSTLSTPWLQWTECLRAPRDDSVMVQLTLEQRGGWGCQSFEQKSACNLVSSVCTAHSLHPRIQPWIVYYCSTYYGEETTYKWICEIDTHII